MAYNNPTTPSVYGYKTPKSATTFGGNATSAVSSAVTATVRCTFIPNLPDELSIEAGETVRIVGEYDDGWALCSNRLGEQGMVPLECLERSSSPGRFLDAEGQSGRNFQRASSLVGAGDIRRQF